MMRIWPWFISLLGLFPLGGQAVEVWVSVHGLNHKHSQLIFLEDYLEKKGRKVERIVLPGHDSEVPLLDLEEDVWTKYILQRLGEIRQKWPESKLCYLGYSMGGALGVYFQQANRGGLHKVILFAPAIELTSFAKLGRYLYPLVFWDKIYGLTPPELRKYKFLTRSYYDEFFRLYDKIHILDSSYLLTPHLIFVHKRDNLVSKKGIEEYMTKNHLYSWRVIDTSFWEKKLEYAHAIVSSDKESQKTILKYVEEFL